ncbi:MAG: Lrp/AsnC family transcriptional regulator [bacterium]
MNAHSLIADETNRKILTVAEDQLQGFHRDPILEISRRVELPPQEVIERLRVMMRAGVIRRVRQTLVNLTSGALAAWKISPSRLDAAFDFLSKDDPFSGHVVIRRADSGFDGEAAQYRLWTTLQVPQGFSLEEHCEALRGRIGAEEVRLMPAQGVFALGVGHVRRETLAADAKADAPVMMRERKVVPLDELEWRVVKALRREFSAEEIRLDLWRQRAREADLDFETFCKVAEQLAVKDCIGRFSVSLEHSKLVPCNGLFLWAAAAGREVETGGEVGRFYALTHCYWRRNGPDGFNIMAMAHGKNEESVLQRKAAIDEHLKDLGIPIARTAVFWSERSSIKPSAIEPERMFI